MQMERRACNFGLRDRVCVHSFLSRRRIIFCAKLKVIHLNSLPSASAVSGVYESRISTVNRRKTTSAWCARNASCIPENPGNKNTAYYLGDKCSVGFQSIGVAAVASLGYASVASIARARAVRILGAFCGLLCGRATLSEWHAVSNLSTIYGRHYLGDTLFCNGTRHCVLL